MSISKEEFLEKVRNQQELVYLRILGLGRLPRFIDNVGEWSNRVFGEGQFTESVCGHLHEEVDEALADPDDLQEWADIILLAFDGARRRGFNGDEILCAIVAKQAINEEREREGRKHRERGEW